MQSFPHARAQELLAIQQDDGPKNLGFFGTRNMGMTHQKLVEILSYAMVSAVRAGWARREGCRGGIRGMMHRQPSEMLYVLVWLGRGGVGWGLGGRGGGADLWPASSLASHARTHCAPQGNHIYTSGATGTNAAVIKGALRAAEGGGLLTVILPQSRSKQPAESQELLEQVRRRARGVEGRGSGGVRGLGHRWGFGGGRWQSRAGGRRVAGARVLRAGRAAGARRRSQPPAPAARRGDLVPPRAGHLSQPPPPNPGYPLPSGASRPAARSSMWWRCPTTTRCR